MGFPIADGMCRLTCGHVQCPGVGYIKLDDLRRLLHALGAGLPQWLIKELTSNVTDLARRGRPDRVYYRDVTDAEIREGSEADRDDGAAPEAK